MSELLEAAPVVIGMVLGLAFVTFAFWLARVIDKWF